MYLIDGGNKLINLNFLSDLISADFGYEMTGKKAP
jgi:hypothetical protein